jgi:hypothetical protein
VIINYGRPLKEIGFYRDGDMVLTGKSWKMSEFEKIVNKVICLCTGLPRTN